MPDRPLTIATYAAGASLAAITLVYVFGPTFFFDDEAAHSSRSSRKKGVVGLVNPANDCFINSVLQALAGLPELRAYLIREVHRRKLDGEEVYNDLTAALEDEKKNPSSKRVPEWQTVGLQQGLVTVGLKEVLDALNERPLYKKTISAQSFIRCVEQAFRTRVSRTQQDAQEFLQVVVERLAEEYGAGKRVRRHIKQDSTPNHWRVSEEQSAGHSSRDQYERPRDSRLTSVTEHDGQVDRDQSANENKDPAEDENVFPLQGRLESQVECLHCHFKPKSSTSTFLTLTLNVPHDSTSSTLNTCFDQLLKQEYIDDFKCDKCRLVHALEVNDRQLTRAAGESRAALELDRAKIQEALEDDPEKPPKDVKLPDIASAPKRKISRYTRISSFPHILAVHLSRSVWDAHAASSKNMAKVSFPESLPLGSLLDRKTYRLLGVVMHKGGHNSGHYESFRRQVLSPPFSTPASLGTEGVYSLKNSPAPSPRVSAVPSPHLGASVVRDTDAGDVTSSPRLSVDSSAILSTPTSATTASSSGSTTSQATLDRRRPQPPMESVPTPGLPTPPQTAVPRTSGETTTKPTRHSSILGRPRKNRANERWWRISDDKVKESKTSDVLAMQREVYMLFYELVPNAEGHQARVHV